MPYELPRPKRSPLSSPDEKLLISLRLSSDSPLPRAFLDTLPTHCLLRSPTPARPPPTKLPPSPPSPSASLSIPSHPSCPQPGFEPLKDRGRVSGPLGVCLASSPKRPQCTSQLLGTNNARMFGSPGCERRGPVLYSHPLKSDPIPVCHKAGTIFRDSLYNPLIYHLGKLRPREKMS